MEEERGNRNCEGSGGGAGTAGFRRQGSGFRYYHGVDISNMEQFLNPEP
jgi:hypothetical protein